MLGALQAQCPVLKSQMRHVNLPMAKFALRVDFDLSTITLNVFPKESRKSTFRPVPKRDGHKDVTTLAAVPDPRKAACLGGKAH